MVRRRKEWSVEMAHSDNEVDRANSARSWLLFRPSEITNSLPQQIRWEFTRRHPYYLQFWQAAQRHHHRPSEHPLERRLGEIAVSILGVIGIAQSQTPFDPHLGPEALGLRDLGGAWVGGAVAPAILRTLAQMLLLALPAPQRSQLGRLLSESAEYDSQDTAHMAGMLRQLAGFHDAAWDSFPSAPIVSINLEMPQRAITDAIEQLVREWKLERGISEHRRRDDKLDEYLAVWDAREGWADGQYDATREKTLQTVAHESGVSIGTVTSRYRSAFRYLSGHEYSPELWIRLMGPLKLSRYCTDQAGSGLTRKRPWRSPSPRPVTETVLLPGRTEMERSEYLAAAGFTEFDFISVDLALDINTLIAKGLTDDQIFETLEMQLPTRFELVSDIRRRFQNQ